MTSPGDARRDASILSSFTDPKTQKVITYPPTLLSELSIFKYYDPASFARNNNYPILRFADVLLINAEALNESGSASEKAYESINKIRRRAKLPELKPGLTQQQFREAVLQERSFEFCFESRRFFDLIRTEMLVPVMNAAGKNPLTGGQCGEGPAGSFAKWEAVRAKADLLHGKIREGKHFFDDNLRGQAYLMRYLNRSLHLLTLAYQKQDDKPGRQQLIKQSLDEIHLAQQRLRQSEHHQFAGWYSNDTRFGMKNIEQRLSRPHKQMAP